MRKFIIFLICLAVFIGACVAWSQISLHKTDAELARLDKILEEAER